MAWRCGAPPSRCSPARPPSCSGCSPCCSRSSRPPAASAWRAPSASSSPRSSRWSCCPRRWCCSAAGSSGRACRHVGDAAPPTAARSGAGSATRGQRAAGSRSSCGTVLLSRRTRGRPGRSKLGLPRPTSSCAKPEAIAAAERLAQSFPAGSADPASVTHPRRRRRRPTALEDVDGVASVTPGRRRQRLHRAAVVLSDPPEQASARAGIARMRDAVAESDTRQLRRRQAAAGARRRRGRHRDR